MNAYPMYFRHIYILVQTGIFVRRDSNANMGLWGQPGTDPEYDKGC